jgi:uracil-DNA glycosylase family 4
MNYKGNVGMNKIEEYKALVAERKACHLCKGLTNPVDIDGGRFDSDQIGAWSLWQGNINASLMVVGQDWGDIGYFIRNKGLEGPHNPTNHALVELVGIGGISIGEPGSQEGRDVVFFTNAILCLKESSGGLQGKVKKEWFNNCAPFLRKQIEIIHPLVVVGLGEKAYRAILSSFNIQIVKFRAEVEAKEGRVLPNGIRAFAVYHCGKRIQNTHRSMDVQRKDWERLQPFLKNSR